MTRLTEQEFAAIKGRRRVAAGHDERGIIVAQGGRGRFRSDAAGGLAAPRRPRHESGKMNRGESDYARHLDSLLAAGEIHGWWYELMAFRLADLCSLTPDFVVLMPDGRIELHEIKGGKWEQRKSGREWTFYAEEDARQKMRVAGRLIPFPLYVVWPRPAEQRKQGGDPWCRQKISGEWWA